MNFTRRETLAGTLGFAATVCAPARAMAELPRALPPIPGYARWALGTARIVAGTDRALTFSGQSDLFVPASGELISDPVALAVPPLGHLAISLRFAEAPSRQIGHPGSRGTAFLLPGDHLSSTDMPDTSRHVGWFQAAGVDVEATTATGGS